MSEEALEALREGILSNPDVILGDDQLMRALLAADRRAALGRNVVDLRGVLVDRLEERLDRLEGTHREVLAAADVTELSFGPEYVIPKPMDPRLLPRVARAVALAAVASGVARIALQDDARSHALVAFIEGRD